MDLTRVRYAPSPTGSPHVGNLRTALYNWIYARKTGGVFIARLEDTNRSPDVYRPEGIWDIESSLRYLGIVPDEWWVSGGPAGPYVQSERLALYSRAAQELIESGDAYRCYCTRERLEEMRAEQQARGAPAGYDRRCRNLSAEQREAFEAQGLSSVVRLAVPLEGQTVLHDLIKGEIRYDNRTQDDQVLLKSDGFPTYFLAAAVDDHAMGVTHVIRGDDWLSSAPKLALIYRAFGWEPPIFAHAPLILGSDRKKLSKRHGATQFTEFIDAGYLPEALFNFLVLLGWSTGEENLEIFSIPEIIERFSLEAISTNPAVFDYEKLKWMNGQYIRRSQPGRIVGMCLPYLIKAGYLSDPPTPEEIEYARRVIPLELERMKLLSDVTELVGFFFKKLDYPEGYEEKAVKKWLGVEHLRAMLQGEIDGFGALQEWSAQALEQVVQNLAAELGVPAAQVIHPTRVAATGRTVGPGIYETLWALGKDRTLARLQTVLDRACGAGRRSGSGGSPE
jgi:glutamyl-tRNA synthetase